MILISLLKDDRRFKETMKLKFMIEYFYRYNILALKNEYTKTHPDTNWKLKYLKIRKT